MLPRVVSRRNRMLCNEECRMADLLATAISHKAMHVGTTRSDEGPVDDHHVAPRVRRDHV